MSTLSIKEDSFSLRWSSQPRLLLLKELKRSSSKREGRRQQPSRRRRNRRCKQVAVLRRKLRSKLLYIERLLPEEVGEARIKNLNERLNKN